MMRWDLLTVRVTPSGRPGSLGTKHPYSPSVAIAALGGTMVTHSPSKNGAREVRQAAKVTG